MSAINQKIRRLPGFRFEAQNPLREDILPRMDVALFVGFASMGPVGIPVAVESAEQFKTIFGDDLPIVWDSEKSETVYAFLAPTVRSFFRNGGKRCWIFRTACVEPSPDKPLNRAVYNYFPLTGLAGVCFEARQISDLMPALALARSKGSWSDDLQIGTAALSRAAKCIDFDKNDGQIQIILEVSANERLKTGELLRLNFSDKGLVLLMTADSTEDGSKTKSPFVASGGKLVQKIVSERFLWLENLPVSSSPPPAETVWIRLWTLQNNLETPEFLPIREAQLEIQPKKKEEIGGSPPKVKLKFTDLPPAESPPVGSLLTTVFEHKLLCLQVETVNLNDSGGHDSVEILGQAVFCSKNEIEPTSMPTVERLTFELWIKKGKKSLFKLSDLAFNAGQERFWGNLPTDEALYGFTETADREIPAWTQTAEAVNFPLAGIEKRETVYFPLFAAAFPENYLGAVAVPGTKLQRDGLEEFNAELFLDHSLKNTGLGNLLNEAEFIRYLSLRPRPLWGIHAALVPETSEQRTFENSRTDPFYANYSLDECTIIAVPDAVHRGWSQTKDEGEVLPPPVFSPPLRPEWWHFQDCRKPDMKKVSEPLWGNFLDCGISVIKTPKNLRVKEESISSGKFTIIWKCGETGKDLEFVLEESTSPKFEFLQEIYRGKDKQFAVFERRAGIYFYRVRAEIGKNVSNWSNGLAVKIPAAENWSVNSSKDYRSDVLLAVQRAMLRMCAARGDLFAVLNLPEHFEETDVFSHVATLKTTKGLASETVGVEPLSADETRALSFAAVYHPWLLTHEDDFAGFRNIPADGAICGVMANRSNQRGAWIAPANERLQGVLGLAKETRRERFLDFQDNLINLVRQEPIGFLVLDSDTLSDDADLRSINVRRLLSLLRRLALKHGAEYVFEPNDERFRRQVQRGFNALLDVMFTRGAFAGATPAASYQVVVSETLNNAQSTEQGRFIVELKVAPSLPLKFVTVRLMQTGGRSNVTEVF